VSVCVDGVLESVSVSVCVDGVLEPATTSTDNQSSTTNTRGDDVDTSLPQLRGAEVVSPAVCV
jgi:hypothetical protein